jgi:hypothetical protein
MECLKCRKTIDGRSKYGLHEQCFVNWFKVDLKIEFESLVQRSVNGAISSQDLERKRSPNNTSFYHGKFKKYSANLGLNNYIIKMREEKDAPELPEVEFLCNQIAHRLSLPVPEFYYIDFYTEKVFVTKVFIKKGAGISNLEHIYKFRSDEKHNCETLAQVIKETTKLPYDVEIFFNSILFDALIGNHDRHGRNLAFIVTSSKTNLSPIYDNVSYLSLVSGPILKADFNPTGRISTADTNEPSMRDYVKELKRLGQRDLINIFYSKIKLTNIDQLIENSFCSDLMKEALTKLIHKRFKELEDAL